MTVVDADQHLLESRTLWADHLDPAQSELALSIEDDEAGNSWLQWRGERIVLADVTTPGDVDKVGERLQRALRGEAPEIHYDDELRDFHWDPDARAAKLADLGVDEAVVVPQLRIGVGARARGRPRRDAGEHGRVEPVDGGDRRARLASRRPPDPA